MKGKHKLYIFLLHFLLCLMMIIYMAIWFPVFLLHFLVIIGIILSFLYFSICHCKYKKVNTANVIDGKQKLLVVVPHPDDELNVAGILIRNVLLRQGEVYIIYTTNFDVYGKKEAYRRLREIKKLCRRLSIPEKNIFYMGYSASMHQGEAMQNSKRYTYALGREETCAMYLYGKEVLQTVDNLQIMLCEMIACLKPDIICGIDYDTHEDHKMTSDAIESAVNRLSQKHEIDIPLVLKGFSYATAWMSVPDFYQNEEYLKSSVINDNKSSFIERYNWENRVRVPYICSTDLGYTLRSSYLYKVYSAYMSQNALSHMNQIVNGDQVFWRLDIGDSLLLPEVGSRISYYKIAAYPNKDFLYELFCKPEKRYQICVLNEKNIIEENETIECFFYHNGKEEKIDSKFGIYTIQLHGKRGRIVCKKNGTIVDSVTVYSNSSMKYLNSFILRKSELVLDWYLKRYRSHLYAYRKNNTK